MFPAETYVIESDLTHHYGLIKKNLTYQLNIQLKTI